MNLTFQNETLENAVQKLKELKNRKRDVVLNLDSLSMLDKGSLIAPYGQEGKKMVLEPLEVANGHIAGKLNIPNGYWKRMMEGAPEIAAANFNMWLTREIEKKSPRRVLLRTYMDEPGGEIGVARAMLSDKYFPIENLDLLVIAISQINEISKARGIKISVAKFDLSETRLYARFVCDDIEAEAKEALLNYRDPNGGAFGGSGKGSGVSTGFVISNSEVGHGKLMIAPRIVVGACANGMVWADEAFTRTHLGAKLDSGIYRSDTKKANVRLIQKMMRDNILKFLSEDYLGSRVKEIEAMASRKIEHPKECVYNMASEIGLNEEESDMVFSDFLRQGDHDSVFSVAQAITSAAHRVDGDKRFQMESAASTLLKIVDKCDRKN